MLPRFPHELLELFVDEVAAITNRAHRASALKSCSLASTCISKRARSHLFSTVPLRWTFKRGLTVVMKKRSSLLKQLMESDPILITFIRVLEVYINDCNDEGIQEANGLPAIITMLYSSPRSRLRSFSLSSFKFRFTRWDSLPTRHPLAPYQQMSRKPAEFIPPPYVFPKFQRFPSLRNGSHKLVSSRRASHRRINCLPWERLRSRAKRGVSFGLEDAARRCPAFIRR